MNQKELKALIGSIQKWHDISYHGARNRGMLTALYVITQRGLKEEILK